MHAQPLTPWLPEKIAPSITLSKCHSPLLYGPPIRCFITALGGVQTLTVLVAVRIHVQTIQFINHLDVVR